MNKNYTVIEDLTSLSVIEDSNYMIVEDHEDTKKATVLDLKKAFSGDYKAASDKTFYSSKKIEEYMSNIKRNISNLADKDEVISISNRIKDIIAEAGSGNSTEVIYARDGEDTLDERLERDIVFAEDKYMKKVRRVIEGKEVSTGNKGYINIYLKNMSSSSAKIRCKSKNILNIAFNTNTQQVTYTDTGFEYKQLNNTCEVLLEFPSSLPKGKYYFFANVEFSNEFKDKGNIKLALNNTRNESAYTEFVYNQSGKFEFEAENSFNQIKLIFNQNNLVENSIVKYKNIMLMTSDKYTDGYLPFIQFETPITKDTMLRNCYNENYDISCSDSDASIVVEYYDNEITANTMHDDIEELKAVLIDKRDKCGLIKDYGKYVFFDNAISRVQSACRVSYDADKYMRNNVPSLKMIFEPNVKVDPVFDVEMTEYIENIESVSLVFYVDKTTSHFFSSTDPITISLCSDSINEEEMVNYLYTYISKDELIQGWNIIKKNINVFTPVGKPNVHGIKYTRVQITRNPGLDNREMHFNSIVFNQKMQPTVLLAFDGIYEEGLSFTYPYLTENQRNIPATILANNRTTFGSYVLNEIVNLRVKHGWDIGQYGCNPNKELLTKDDNPREQYLALKNAKGWLQDNLVYNPISYSAPNGDLRPITVPLLKDVGYKIAKTQSTGYCNFFDPRYDFAIPMKLMNKLTTADEIIDKIQYAMDNDCCVCIYTNNVTQYGSEIDAKTDPFKAVINFIIQNRDNITPMTLSDFYNKCNS